MQTVTTHTRGFAMSTMSLQDFLDKTKDGLIFRATFIKKGTGETRVMLCRRGVKKGVKGVLPPGQRKEEDARCGVFTVYDMMVKDPKTEQRGAFRRINLEGLISIAIKKKVWNYVNGTFEENV